MPTIPASSSLTRIRLRRAARALLWPHPALYFPIGLLRGRGNILRTDYELFMAGYPRCGNTFTRHAFLAVNPGARIITHQCIPSFVLHLAHSGVPGLLLIRNPLDAAISWAIHQNLSAEDPGIRRRFSSAVWGVHRDLTLEEAIAYWNDYHETLLPIRSKLFIARFEDVTRDFGAVIRGFNARWEADYTPFKHTAESAAKCFDLTEEEHRLPGGKVLEMQVCRPSPERDQIKAACLAQVERSIFFRAELRRARKLYDAFVNSRPNSRRQQSTRLIPAGFDDRGLLSGDIASI